MYNYNYNFLTAKMFIFNVIKCCITKAHQEDIKLIIIKNILILLSTQPKHHLTANLQLISLPD